MIDSTKEPNVVNWPNILTVARVFMAVLVPIYLLNEAFGYQLLAGVIFTIAALTDWFDGQIARKYNLITTFGKIADPIADKLLTLGAFTTLSVIGLFPFWILIPILIREIGITLLRFYFLYKGEAVAAVKSGKQKTAIQITAISLTYFNYIYQLWVLEPNSSALVTTFGTVLNVLMWASLLGALILTVYSGIIFMRNNQHLFVSQPQK